MVEDNDNIEVADVAEIVDHAEDSHFDVDEVSSYFEITAGLTDEE